MCSWKERKKTWSMRLSEDRLPTAHWLIDWAWEQWSSWMLLVSTNIKRNTGRDLSLGKRKMCRNHCHGNCSHIETNKTKLSPTSAYLISTKHKKSQPVQKRFYPKKLNGIAHFIILRASLQGNKCEIIS